MFEQPKKETAEAALNEARSGWRADAPGAPVAPPSIDGRPSALWGDAGATDTRSSAGTDFTSADQPAPPSDGVTFKFGSPSPRDSAPSVAPTFPGPTVAAPSPSVPQSAGSDLWNTPVPAPSGGDLPAQEFNFSHIPPAEPPAKRGIGKWLGLVTAGLALVVGGFFIGSQLRGDDGETTDTAASTDVEIAERDTATSAQTDTSQTDTSADTTAATSAASAPELVGAEEASASGSTTTVTANSALAGSLEPVADVAEVLSPSVVQISDNVGGSGSGIVYDNAGHIVTNAHVVGESATVTVIFQDGSRIEGIVVGTDPETDVAVVKVEPSEEDLVVAQFANVADLRAGATAIAIGSPFGYDQTVTAGIVSSTRRPVASDQNQQDNTVVPMIQTDAPINPGNSGGALADITGAVIGMNTLIRSTGTLNGTASGNIGIGFAIPSDIIQLVANGIIAGDPVQPSLLGVATERSVDFQLGEPGARVTSVTLGGAADLAGIEIGDRLTRFDGVPLSDFNDLAGVVRLSEAGVPLPVELYRDGEFMRLDVELETR